ncbi:Spindle pole body protein [Fusarium acuminatum]|uniref:Spindle pole body protein n=1 Tax=Fusarium acuminatum TaxID=5515 RepID=A0ABZ2WK31_9HYPO
MAPSDATLPATRRTRRSIGAHTDVNRAFEKENATVDVTAASRKKSRSKSLGPGGLDALMKANGNRRASLAAPSRAPRSILKQTMPIPEIPPLKPKQPDLIDFGSPTRQLSTPTQSSADNSGSKIAVKTEEEQQAAAREREERERRDARRKSLANRRVSFAAEATLHTFHEVEFNQDSTTSTDSTRRNSAYSNSAQAQQKEEETNQRRSSGPPPINFHNSDDDTATTLYSSDSEPADAVEEVADIEEDGDEDGDSSESDDGTMMTVDDVTGTTAASDRSVDSDGESSTLDEALRLAARRAGNQQLEDEEDEEDDLDDDEEFIPSFGWGKDANKQNVAAQDQENLPPPARTQPPQPTQNTGDATETNMSMDMDMDMDMTRAVGGIIKPQHTQQYDPDEDMSMDVTRVIGGILKPKSPQEQNTDEDMSMDVTRAFGGIVNQPRNTSASHGAEEEDEEDDVPMEEATMEFTTAIGGIQRPAPQEENEESDDNEDMSMDLTTVLGGLLSKNKRKSVAASRRRTVNQEEEEDDNEAPMDMTLAVGQILSKPGGEETEENEDMDEDDATIGMDMTTAIGGILSRATAGLRNLGKRVMEEEADSADAPDEALQTAISKTAMEEQLQPPVTSEKQAMTPSPGPSKTPTSASRRTIDPKISTPQLNPRNSRTPSPVKATTTPQSRKARTPTSNKVATPQLDSVVSERTATPRSLQRNTLSASPKRPSSVRTTRTSSRTPSPVKSTPKQSLFQSTLRNNNRTPTSVSTPQRRLSGLGADRAGLGSPQVAALFDRRGSIGDMATTFVPGKKRGVMFEDPTEMAEEVEREAQQEEDKENRRKILEREADSAEATLNLREMIDSLSPKRKPLKGRKSLHVGSARGLLGKRPNELDDEEDDPEENDGVKRLKGHHGSPVKNIRLQQPPSKEETTGRLNLSFRKSLQPNTATPTLLSPEKPDAATTPRHQGRFKNIEDDRAGHQVNFDETPIKDAEQLEDEAEAEADEDGERIHLQDFLNMTSIRFMELTTTKRRHTQAPGTLDNGFLDEGEENLSLDRCVVAGACTVPMLELYQHSCRELKKYISEGRRIVKEIETDTFEDNPPLFKEYMAATPEIKTLMDKQFMNVKNHARLLSKAMWYEWRMKLQEGLKEGLLGIDEGMEVDKELLDKQKSLLDSVLPAIVARYKLLVEESSNLEEVAQELADCDPADLEAARDELASLDEDVDYKRKRIAELREQFQASEIEVEDLITQKQNCIEDIAESEKIREECRGWTSTEVNSLKARVDAIEKQYGWAVTGISGTVLSMAYNREIEIVFDITSFQDHQPNSTIDLWYIADNREQNALPKTTEKEFFLQSIRDHARALPHNRTEVSHLLASVKSAWDRANLVSSQVARLNATFPTTVERTSDSSVAITTSMLLVPLETRLEIKLNLHGQSNGEGLRITITPEAKVLYGEHFNVPKIVDYLTTRIGKAVGSGEEQWSDVVVELHGRLIARGRKQG